MLTRKQTVVTLEEGTVFGVEFRLIFGEFRIKDVFTNNEDSEELVFPNGLPCGRTSIAPKDGWVFLDNAFGGPQRDCNGDEQCVLDFGRQRFEYYRYNLMKFVHDHHMRGQLRLRSFLADEVILQTSHSFAIETVSPLMDDEVVNVACNCAQRTPAMIRKYLLGFQRGTCGLDINEWESLAHDTDFRAGHKDGKIALDNIKLSCQNL